jgi:hypothetical protein
MSFVRRMRSASMISESADRNGGLPSSYSWDISIRNIRRFSCICPQNTCNRRSIHWMRSRSWAKF